MSKTIAIFGDVHGHLRLMFQLARLWQIHSGVCLDAVFQCGDLGYFPNPAGADKATRRFARMDPEELSFSRFFLWPEPPEADALLKRMFLEPQGEFDAISCPVIWCNGNHEDFALLERFVGSQPLASVDAYGKLCLLQSGCVEDLGYLRLAALGGGPESDDEDSSHGHPWQRVSALAFHRLAGKTDFDVLLTHCGAAGVADEGSLPGSRSIRQVIDRCQPAVHFYSHHHGPIQPATLGQTRSFWLSDVNFAGRGAASSVNDGCMGILEWQSRDNFSFRIVDDQWFHAVRRSDWQYL